MAQLGTSRPLPNPVDSNAIIAWPEFLALATRLGIPIQGNRLTKLVITLEEGCVVIVDHTYQATDTKVGDYDTPDP